MQPAILERLSHTHRSVTTLARDTSHREKCAKEEDQLAVHRATCCSRRYGAGTGSQGRTTRDSIEEQYQVKRLSWAHGVRLLIRDGQSKSLSEFSLS